MKAKHASGASPKKPISPAAQRPPEVGRSGQLDPVRYGDWEIKGIATDF